jgi:phosphoribosyl-AMP cyclohydrolase / phosphoribosyl-ATP pyrophosphohydrolase
MLDLDALDFAKGNGFVTVVTQDASTGTVLMVARADREALERTVASGEMHYHSRTRGPWHKGATSGHVQRIVSLTPDCDGDVVLASVIPAGPACHTGRVSCFANSAGWGSFPARQLGSPNAGSLPAANPGSSHPDSLEQLSLTIRARTKQGVEGSYTKRLLDDRNLRLKKLGEEAAELAVACADGDRTRAIEEATDLLYHTLVALAALEAGLDDVRATLDRRKR